MTLHPLNYSCTTDDVVVKDAKGPVSRRFRFTKTHQGPLVAIRDGKPLAIRLAKLEEGGAIEQSYAMGRAKSVSDFKEAMRPCNLGQSVTAARTSPSTVSSSVRRRIRLRASARAVSR